MSRSRSIVVVCVHQVYENKLFVKHVVLLLLYCCCPVHPVLAPGSNAALHPFIDFGAMYIVCLFTSFASPLRPMLFHFFLTYLLVYLSFAWRIDPLHFKAGDCNRD